MVLGIIIEPKLVANQVGLPSIVTIMAMFLGGRVLGDLFALELVDIFLNTEYEGGRHQNRLDKIAAIEEENA